jgi:hypothetical protein
MEKQSKQKIEAAQGEVKELPRQENDPRPLNEPEQEAARGGGGGVPGSPRDRRLD